MNPDALAGLKEIHLPPPVGWWPPAPGWWLLGLLALLLAWGSFRWVKRRRRRGALGREAKAELAALQQRYRETGDAKALAEGLSRLLRRVALSCFPAERVAGLTGEAWLRFLDEALGEADRPFEKGAGRALIEAPYRPGMELEADSLLELAARWIGRVSRGGCHA